MRPIKVGNSTIELSKSANFLGAVILDNKLNFNEHITKIAKKSHGLAHAMQKSCWTDLGTHS